MPFGALSLMNLLMARALSEEMPAFKVMVWRAVPLAASSTLPWSSAFSEILRFTSFSSRTTTRARSRSSVEEWRRISWPASSTVESVFLKSKRVEISLAA